MYNIGRNNYYFNILDERPNIIRGAIKADLEELQSALIENPNCINDTDPATGVTALFIAAIDGNYSIVDFLCDQPGIKVDIMDKFGRTAYMAAIEIGRDDILERIMRDTNRSIAKLEAIDDAEESAPNITAFRPKPPTAL